jgi:NADH:flavin oxidoreductase / NADH oxidase family
MQTIADALFRIAAEAMRSAGFAGLQMYGAHGYLLSQSLSPHSNLCDDAGAGRRQRLRRPRHKVREPHTDLRGLVHGSLIAALKDDVMGLACG